MFVVTVTFRLKSGQRAAFLPLMLENARLSRALEPGCAQFDVCESEDEIFLYELYSDAAAFEQHKTMPHYLTFSETTAPMVAEKHVRTYALIDQRSRP